MPLSGPFIQVREFAINPAFRIPNKEVLNSKPFRGTTLSSLELVSQIKQAVSEFKQQAMDDPEHTLSPRSL